jgi:3-oxoacyl-[acyl-carrier-protein] synthase II
MSGNRVVITGIGTVNPLGNDVESTWKALINGVSGINHIEGFDTSDFSTRIGGQVKNFDPESILDKKEARRTSKFILYALAASKQAVAQSGLDIASAPHRVGVEIGSGIGGIEILEESARSLHEKGPSKVGPFTVPMMIGNMAAGLVSQKLGAKGPNSCSVTACTTGANCIGNAYHIIKRGEASAMLAGGSECAITPLGLASFCAARSLSTNNENPQQASRPFDLTRDGFVMGDGAGVLVLEDLEHARKRNANILGEIIGFGCSGDAYHITAPAPEGEGASRAIKNALQSAGITANDVDYVNAHGTSTALNDKNETAAIKSALGERAYKIPVSSTKSMTGHLLGAAGALEAIISLLTLNNGVVPPTINYSAQDPDCDLNFVPNQAKEYDALNIAISNSFGFGGHNGVVVIKRFV